MLMRRIVTAVVLLALLVPALLSSAPWPFQALTLAIVSAAGWEWSRLNGRDGLAAWGLGGGVALACLAAWSAGWLQGSAWPAWMLPASAWIVGAPWVLRRGPGAWGRLPALSRQLLGAGLLFAAWLALARVRLQGVAFVMSVFCVVWVADVAAYFGGHRWGRLKLAPSISPGKTWEGAASGQAGVLALAIVWGWAEHHWAVMGPSLFAHLRLQYGLGGALLLLCALTALSVAGDLFESLVKRAAGVKDSSGLLPGHGGVLDRIDALMPVFPVVALLLALGGLSP